MTGREHAKVCRWIKGQQVEYDTQACIRCRRMDDPASEGREQTALMTDEPVQQVCAVQVWLDGIYRTDCSRYIVNGECLTHGKGGPTRPVTPPASARDQA